MIVLPLLIEHCCRYVVNHSCSYHTGLPLRHENHALPLRHENHQSHSCSCLLMLLRYVMKTIIPQIPACPCLPLLAPACPFLL